ICKCFVPLHFETENKKKPSTSNQPDTLQQNSSPKSKQETATQFRPSVKATFPPWGFVADALKRCVAKKSAKCPCKQRHLFFCVAISDCVKGFVWRSP